MSALYNLEPQPTAKVVLNTTAGDLSLELFAKQTPLASRNFLQHCLDGYYTGTIFHRLVPGFIIQGGDPTGTGAGGQTADDAGGLEDEIHSRLKFNRRGLLGMAKSEDGYGSQFFLTLGETRELQGVMTMFGRIEGETIYNLMKMGEAELAEGEGSERPLYPVKITGAEVLVNPFEGMVARVREAPRVKEVISKESKKRKKVGKNVLSFGGGDEDGEEVMPVMKKVKANPKLVSVGLEEPEKMNNTTMPQAPAAKAKKIKQREEEGDEEVVEANRPAVAQSITARKAPLRDDDKDDDYYDDSTATTRPSQPSALDRTNAEIAALKASMKRTAPVAPTQNNRPKNALEAMIPATSTRGRKRGANKAADEKGAFNLFQSFKQRLEELPADEQVENDHARNGAGTEARKEASIQPTAAPSTSKSANTAALAAGEDEDDEAALCDLHFVANCQSCRSWADDDALDPEKNTAEGEDEDDGPGWMAHRLTFAKDTLGKDLEWRRKMEEIEVIDPREKAREILMGDGKGKGKGGKGKGIEARGSEKKIGGKR